MTNLHVSCESGEALATASTDTEEQSISERLADDATDATEVSYCVHEENELHLIRVDLIVLLQKVLQHSGHLGNQL